MGRAQYHRILKLRVKMFNLYNLLYGIKKEASIQSLDQITKTRYAGVYYTRIKIPIKKLFQYKE